MRLADAPKAGWYPDPGGGSRLRWWDGSDWSDRWRAPPTSGVLRYQQEHAAELIKAASDPGSYSSMGSLNRQDSEAIINQVRLAARAEAERAAAMFGAQARSATQNIVPLISQYTSRITRWFRIASVIAIVLLLGWLAFQIFAQVSMFQWIGDRIDNITDNGGLIVPRWT
jgi:Protein of unknown function (DUF2510)